MSARDDYPMLAAMGVDPAHPWFDGYFGGPYRALDEIDRLRRWRDEAATVLMCWDQAWRDAGSPGALGSSKSAALGAEVARLRDLVAAQAKALRIAAAEVLPGPDGQDNIDRERLIATWIEEGVESRDAERADLNRAVQKYLAERALADDLAEALRRHVMDWGGDTCTDLACDCSHAHGKRLLATHQEARR